MSVQGREEHIRRKPAAVILANDATGKMGFKQGVYCSFPVLQFVRADVGTKRPGHLDSKTDAFVTCLLGVGNELAHLLRLFVGTQFSGLPPFFSGPKFEAS